MCQEQSNLDFLHNNDRADAMCCGMGGVSSVGMWESVGEGAVGDGAHPNKDLYPVPQCSEQARLTLHCSINHSIASRCVRCVSFLSKWTEKRPAGR